MWCKSCICDQGWKTDCKERAERGSQNWTFCSFLDNLYVAWGFWAANYMITELWTSRAGWESNDMGFVGRSGEYVYSGSVLPVISHLSVSAPTEENRIQVHWATFKDCFYRFCELFQLYTFWGLYSLGFFCEGCKITMQVSFVCTDHRSMSRSTDDRLNRQNANSPNTGTRSKFKAVAMVARSLGQLSVQSVPSSSDQSMRTGMKYR